MVVSLKNPHGLKMSLGGGNSNIFFNFHPYLPGEIFSNLTVVYFFRWVGKKHHLVKGLLRDHKLFINCLQGGLIYFLAVCGSKGPGGAFGFPMMLGCWVNFR